MGNKVLTIFEGDPQPIFGTADAVERRLRELQRLQQAAFQPNNLALSAQAPATPALDRVIEAQKNLTRTVESESSKRANAEIAAVQSVTKTVETETAKQQSIRQQAASKIENPLNPSPATRVAELGIKPSPQQSLVAAGPASPVLNEQAQRNTMLATFRLQNDAAKATAASVNQIGTSFVDATTKANLLNAAVAQLPPELQSAVSIAKGLPPGFAAAAASAALVGSAVAVAGIAVVNLTSAMKTEAERRLALEEKIQGAYNRQIFSLRAITAEFEKQRALAGEGRVVGDQFKGLVENRDVPGIENLQKDFEARAKRSFEAVTQLKRQIEALEADQNSTASRETSGFFGKNSAVMSALGLVFTEQDKNAAIAQIKDQTRQIKEQLALAEQDLRFNQGNVLQADTARYDSVTGAARDQVTRTVDAYRDAIKSAEGDIRQSQELLRGLFSVQGLIDPAEFKTLSDTLAKQISDAITSAQRSRQVRQDAANRVAEAQLQGHLVQMQATEVQAIERTTDLRNRQLQDSINADRAYYGALIANAAGNFPEIRKLNEDLNNSIISKNAEMQANVIRSQAEIAQKQRETAREIRSAFVGFASQQNPYVKIYDEAAESIERVNRLTRGLGSNIRTALQASAQEARNFALSTQKIQDTISAFNLQDRARDLRRGFESGDEDSIRERATRRLFPNYSSNEAREAHLQNEIRIERENEQRERQGDLDRRIRAAQEQARGGSESQRRVADQAIIGLTQGMRPGELAREQRELAARASEAEAKRLVEMQEKATKLFDTINSLLGPEGQGIKVRLSDDSYHLVEVIDESDLSNTTRTSNPGDTKNRRNR